MTTPRKRTAWCVYSMMLRPKFVHCQRFRHRKIMACECVREINIPLLLYSVFWTFRALGIKLLKGTPSSGVAPWSLPHAVWGQLPACGLATDLLLADRYQKPWRWRRGQKDGWRNIYRKLWSFNFFPSSIIVLSNAILAANLHFTRVKIYF